MSEEELEGGVGEVQDGADVGSTDGVGCTGEKEEIDNQGE